MSENQLIEEQWNNVSVGGGNDATPYTINSRAVSTSWYNREINESTARYKRLKQYFDADNKSIEISRALDVIAEDVSGSNADDNDFFVIDYPENSDVKRSQINLTNHALGIWQKRTGFDQHLFDRVRKTLLLGITFYEIQNDGSLIYLPSEKFVGYIVSEQDRRTITHYIYDDEKQPFDDMGYQDTTKKRNSFTNIEQDDKNYKAYSVDDLLVMKVGNGPFGESLVQKVYCIWRQMEMLERAVVIYRITRSSEKRVYYIDTGNLQGKKRDAAINKQQIRLKQKKTSKTGELTSDYSPESMGEDLFIPSSGNGRGSKVETLNGGSNLGEMDDVKWFANKLKDGMRVPESMIGSASDDRQSEYNDMRVGQAYQVEVRYMGMCKRHKRRLNVPLRENFVDFCKDREISVHPDMEMSIQNSQSFSEYKQMEKDQTQLNIFNSTTQIDSLSSQMALTKYLDFSKEDLERNELLKLKEYGLSEETISKMEESEKSTLVYSDSPNEEVLSKYNVTAGNSSGF